MCKHTVKLKIIFHKKAENPSQKTWWLIHKSSEQEQMGKFVAFREKVRQLKIKLLTIKTNTKIKVS